jgi:integrase
LLDALRANYEARGKSGARLLSNLKPLEEHFGDYRATELTGADVDRFITHAKQHGRRVVQEVPGKPTKAKPAKDASINRCLQLLRQSYKLALRDGKLTSAPYIQRLSEVGNARQGFFDAPDFYRVLGHLPLYLQDYTLFAYLTGWRAGEIRSLSWLDIDGDTIKLQAIHSKNRTARTIPLAGELAELIERRKAARLVKTTTGTVQTMVQAKHIFHCKGEPVGDFRKAWATACKLAGCPGKLFHDLRRTAVRDMVRSGTPQTVAMSISGHKTASIFQRYSITDTRDQQTALLNRQTYAIEHLTETETVQ